MPTLAVSAPSFEWSSHKEMFSLTPQSCQHHDNWEAYCPRLLVCQVWTLDVLFRTPPHLQESSATSVRIERVTVAQPTVWQGATAYPNTHESSTTQDVPFRSSPHSQEKQCDKRVYCESNSRSTHCMAGSNRVLKCTREQSDNKSNLQVLL